jgi:hypothetical protein
MKAGDKFHVSKSKHTLGPKIGTPGFTRSIHHIVEHPHVVAKVSHKDDGVFNVDRKIEEAHLKAVGEHHGSVETDDGHHIILATKKTGAHITHTNAYKDAKTDEERKAVLDKAKKLMEERNTHHVETHGLVRTYVSKFKIHRHISLHSPPPYLTL